MQTNNQILNDLNAICRICLCKNDEMKDIFGEKIEEVALSEIFNSITNFKVVKDDGFPKLVCDVCAKKLVECYALQKQIESSYEILQKWAENKDEKNVDLLYDLDVDEQFESDGEGLEEEKQRAPKKQTQRLARVDYNEVVKAIEDSKKKFLENTLCIYCGFVGSNSRALAIHMSRLHKTAKERWCSHCNTEFPDLAEHTTTTHAQTDIRCQFCEKSFTSRGHLTEHLRSHTTIRPFKCTNCEKSFISARHLKSHFRTHTNEQPYECTVCKKRFTQSVSLKKHLGTHANGDSFTCSYCDGVFNDKNSLVVHDCAEKDLESPLNYCKRCKRKVKSLETHLKRVHSNGEPTEKVVELELCTMCGRQFKTAAKLKIHMRIHTGEAPYKCSFCDKRMVTRNNLVVHERVHTGEKPHGCNVCGKRFSQWSVLNTHMRIHNGRPEVCTLCSKRFCRPVDLKLHMRRHTGEKPFLCVHCGQGFVQRSHLTEHTRIHSEERPYQCPYCEKAFKQNSSLKQHVDIHLGNKPFKCTQCPYACRQAYSLTQHMTQHTADQPLPEKPHVCLICRKSFSTIAMLISHTSIQHKANLLKVE